MVAMPLTFPPPSQFKHCGPGAPSRLLESRKATAAWMLTSSIKQNFFCHCEATKATPFLGCQHSISPYACSQTPAFVPAIPVLFLVPLPSHCAKLPHFPAFPDIRAPIHYLNQSFWELMSPRFPVLLLQHSFLLWHPTWHTLPRQDKTPTTG